MNEAVHPLESTFETVELVDTVGILSSQLDRQFKAAQIWADIKPLIRERLTQLAVLDTDQLAVVEAPTDIEDLSVHANAGTGKTYAVLRRVLHRCLVENISPSQFTLVAFNNKAARQLHDKWFELLGVAPSEEIPAPRCTTLHALGYLTILSLHGPCGILNEREKHIFIREWMTKEGEQTAATAGNYADALEAIALSGITLHETDPDIILDVGCKAVPTVEPMNLQKLRKDFEVYKKAVNKFAFEDLPLRGSMFAAEASAEVRQMLNRLHKYIICDEAQDLDRTQYNLIRNLSRSITLIGDTKQTLYVWRQADPNILQLHSLRKLYLTHNYRSDKRIVEFGNYAHQLFTRRDPSSTATHGNLSAGHAVRISRAKTPDHEKEVVTARIVGLIKDGVSPSDIAILTHTNNQCRGFEAMMISNQIPYRLKQHRTTLAESAEYMVLAALAQLERNPNDRNALLVLAEHTKGIGGKTLDTLARNQSFTINNSRIQRSLDRHKSMAERLKDGTPDGPEEKIAYWASVLTENGEIEIDHDRLAESVNLMFEVVKRPTDPDLAALAPDPMAAIALAVSDTPNEGRPRVTVSTLHAVKGLEWDHVFMPHLNHNPYLGPQRFAHEMDCWLYTGITRAKKMLCLTYASNSNPIAGQQFPGKVNVGRPLDLHESLLRLMAVQGE